MGIKIRKAERSDIEYIASRMRKADVDEIAAMGKTPTKALRDGFVVSEAVMTVVADGEPAMMFGINSVSMVSRSAIVWALGTDRMFEHKFAMVRKGKRIINNWLAVYNTLYNIIDARNVLSIRWLEMIGFTIDYKRPIDVNGYDFYRFEVNGNV